MIGQLLVDDGQFAQAVESLRQASVLAPEDLGIREHLAMALLYNKQPREASDIFARLLKEEPQSIRPELWIALGQCQLETNRVSDARSSFDKATQLDASSAVAWRNLAKATLELGDTRRAEIVLRKAMTIQSENSECHLMLGYIRLRQERLNDALVEFQSASLLDRNDTLSLCMIGHVLEKMGKQTEALKYYARALKIEPDDKLAAKLMASVGTDEQ
jgi:cytochrome c-type biogenesis protein CcmH/NrfG